MILELQIPDGEESKFVELQPWEIEFMSPNIQHDPAEPRIYVRTKDDVEYYPIQIDFQEIGTRSNES